MLRVAVGGLRWREQRQYASCRRGRPAYSSRRPISRPAVPCRARARIPSRACLPRHGRHHARREQLAAILDQRPVPVVRRGDGSESGPVQHHGAIIFRCSRPRRPPPRERRRTNSTSPIRPRNGTSLSDSGVQVGIRRAMGDRRRSAAAPGGGRLHRAGITGRGARRQSRARRRGAQGRRRRCRQRRHPGRRSTRINAGLFPAAANETHTFEIRDPMPRRRYARSPWSRPT